MDIFSSRAETKASHCLNMYYIDAKYSGLFKTRGGICPHFFKNTDNPLNCLECKNDIHLHMQLELGSSMTLHLL